jgi:N-glycosylase/DNA lyase
MIAQIPISLLNETVVEVATQLPLRIRLAVNGRQKEESELWRELVAAILGSAVYYQQAISALSILDAHGLTIPSPKLANQAPEIHKCLKFSGYRFPVIRAQQIAESAAAIYGKSRTLKATLESHNNSREARRKLITICSGLGPKQASLFLRNVGYDDLAILDRHVLAYLRCRGMYFKPAASISSIKMYEVIEQVVFDLAADLGLPVSDFDLSVWVTIRAAAGVKPWA